MAQVQTMVSPRHVGTDRLGRYYTKRDMGLFLIDQMDNHKPCRLLDLGAGGGSLSSAAVERWSTLELLTVDIDHNASEHLLKVFKGSEGLVHSHLRTDALSARLPELILPRFEQFDTAICNPPFAVPKWRKGFGQILEAAGFSGCIPFTNGVDAALLFLAQNLRLLGPEAKLAIILPDSLISAQKYLKFRKELLHRYRVLKVIRLPRGSFHRTDALASLVILGNGKSTDGMVSLFELSATNGLSSELIVEGDEGVTRLDYEFHIQRLKHTKRKTEAVPLSRIALSVKRGSFSKAEARSLGASIFHTTDMDASVHGKWCDLSRFSQPHDKNALTGQCAAAPGDILVARVGRNLESKVIGVAAGKPLITDCVYKIQVPMEYRNALLAKLSAPDGTQWLASQAYGVGAKQLTKSDLLTFPFRY
jgi:type I restriction enzyme M protein